MWEHNGDDSILYADNFVGAYTRGESKDIALQKMKREVMSYLRWKGEVVTDSLAHFPAFLKTSPLLVIYFSITYLSVKNSPILFCQTRQSTCKKEAGKTALKTSICQNREKRNVCMPCVRIYININSPILFCQTRQSTCKCSACYTYKYIFAVSSAK